MTKKYALLIGITYPGTNAYLPGCDNDILEIYKFLNARGYTEYDVLCDTDVFNTVGVKVNKPTVSVVVQSFFKLLSWAKANPTGQIFLHYSGHGTQVADSNWIFNEANKAWETEEEDGKDECLVTQDLHLIADDQLKWLFSQLPATITLFSLMDSCHSGSAFDLKYYLKNPNELTTTKHGMDMNAEVIMISGCRDDQYGQSCVFGAKWYGVMTYAFLYLMKYMNNYNISSCSLNDVWKNMGIICSTFPQIPQASCSKNNFHSANLICTSTNFEIQKIQPTVLTTAVRKYTPSRTQNKYYNSVRSVSKRGKPSKRWAM
tara:strand:- start:733 stop:1683 length:951 start_codon:yes stop_codon:yes gene_type:complete